MTQSLSRKTGVPFTVQNKRSADVLKNIWNHMSSKVFNIVPSQQNTLRYMYQTIVKARAVVADFVRALLI